jgi:stearoyl-CoA desaturase (delta-9 desaturase)
MPRTTLFEKTSGAYRTVQFIGVHVATVALAVLAGLPTLEVALFAVATYLVRMFFVTGALHRYFSHRTYKTSRAFQALLALGSLTALQKGVLWWAAHHRHHHRYSDTERDVHSPVQRGFVYSHIGWILDPQWDETRTDQIKDFARYPELRLLDSNVVMVLLFAALCAVTLFAWGFQAMVWGWFVSTVLLWHGTFTINSLAHVWGRRVYATEDTSRNNWLLALLTLGEGWHNNHHYFPSSCAQGFRWYEVDVTYRVLWLLEKVGLVWDLKQAPAEVVAGRLGGRDWRIEAAPTAPEPERIPVATGAEPVSA